jgi:hypothetical protein
MNGLREASHNVPDQPCSFTPRSHISSETVCAIPDAGPAGDVSQLKLTRRSLTFQRPGRTLLAANQASVEEAGALVAYQPQEIRNWANLDLGSTATSVANATAPVRVLVVGSIGPTRTRGGPAATAAVTKRAATAPKAVAKNQDQLGFARRLARSCDLTS